MPLCIPFFIKSQNLLQLVCLCYNISKCYKDVAVNPAPGRELMFKEQIIMILIMMICSLVS